MPEFAEVNLQVSYLRERCTGWEIASWGFGGKHFKGEAQEGLDAFFEGNRVTSITQRGKQVILRTEKGVVSSHLMFRGRWSVQGDPFTSNYKHHKALPTDKSRTFWIVNEAGERLNFHTPEHMAKIHVWPGVMDPAQVDALRQLGPEILVLPETDPAFAGEAWTLAQFRAKAGRSKQAIKAYLLDQKKQSGMGNMYVCEALYDAKVSPDRPSNSLSEDELAGVHRASVEILRRALETKLDYGSLLRIYHHEEDPEGRAVEVSKVGGRDTWWVPEVQV